MKSVAEIAGMRASCRIAALALAAVSEMVKPGITTGELDRQAEKLIKQESGEPAFKGYRGFPASICTSVDSEVVHGIPGDRRLEEGQIVSIDLGTLKGGYYGDMAVTLPVGEVSREAGELIAVTRSSLQRGLEQGKAGGHLHDIGRAIQGHVEEQGFSVVRDFVGHGIGRSLWEEPQVPNFYPGTEGQVMEAGLALAIEPMVNRGGYEVKVLDDGWTVVTADGSLSAHFEHTVVVSEEGCEILTEL